jgi:hypothetical protein
MGFYGKILPVTTNKNNEAIFYFFYSADISFNK